MFKIFADAHKIIANEIYNNILSIYNIELDKESLQWGAILPDILPKYKLIRHYKDESLDYISNEIVRIIHNNRNLDLEGDIDPLTLKLLSKRIGIVSHYIADYTCLAHAKRWTFKDNMFKHIKYESKLNEFAKSHKFSKNKIKNKDISIVDFNLKSLKYDIMDYINKIIKEEYSLKESFENDMDFALELNLKISYLILDMIKIYSIEIENQFILEN